MNLEKIIFSKVSLRITKFLIDHPYLLKFLLNPYPESLYSKILARLLERTSIHKIKHISIDKYVMVGAMIKSLQRVKNNLSEKTKEKLSYLGLYMITQPKISEKLSERYKIPIPGFVTISPTNACNLHCKGCYAESGNYKKEKLSFEEMDWILKEVRKMGIHFVVISGGEPLVWKTEKGDIFDIAKKYSDIMFLMYTNGVLWDEKKIEIASRLGNISPAISIEGFKEKTDSRRGKGTFDKILYVMKLLRKHKVLFGISLTATKQNLDEIVNEEFIKFFFEKQGAAYGWIFQYMPIGRNPDTSLMITPEQRKILWYKEQELMKKGYFLPDFWNSGTLSDGCIAGARAGGYFHITWEGYVDACVFFPYHLPECNIRKAIKENKKLIELLKNPFFEKIQEWQERYGYKRAIPRNWIMPCPVRDHFSEAKKIVKKTKAVGDDYFFSGMDEKMITYNRRCAKLLDPIWKEKYLKT